VPARKAIESDDFTLYEYQDNDRRAAGEAIRPDSGQSLGNPETLLKRLWAPAKSPSHQLDGKRAIVRSARVKL
jgi:hypothetical protein